MPEYFVMMNSFAAPMFSNTSNRYVEAQSPKEALEIAAGQYKHPAHLYSAVCYRNADAYHKGEASLAMWLSAKAELIENSNASSIYCASANDAELDGVKYHLDNPYAGRVV